MLASGRLSKAICDRCHLRVPWQSLVPDGNSPGLKVCPDCADVLDPWRLPAPEADVIALAFVRPDVDLNEALEPALLTEDSVYALAGADGAVWEYT
jgi:NAD-dependent SIR2 family protein deacetylase